MKSMKEAWKPEGLWINNAYVGNGVLLYTCNATNSNYPLGSVWVNLTSNSFGQAVCEIVDIYVPEQFRRMGVATHLMKMLLEAYGILKTGTGTTRGGGLALMRSMRWKQNRKTGEWYLYVEVKKIKKS